MMRIRPATEADLDDIAALQADAPEASQWRPRDYLEHLTLLAEDAQGRAAGFVVVRSVAPGEHEVLNLVVDAACRRQGVGLALLAGAGAIEAGRYFLEVRESNRGAREFYRGAGFAEAGRRRGYYASPEEDAIVMSGILPF
jgi:[ribosomal protein S18]-alanine N-acetyltransferase